MTDSSPGHINKSAATFLSSGVHHILVEVSQTCKQQFVHGDEICHLTENFTFNWEKIGKLLNVTDYVDILQQPSEWVYSATTSVWPIYLETYSAMTSGLIPGRLTRLLDLCKWTQKEREIGDHCNYFFSFEGTSPLEAVLYLTSVIERSLGNVFLVKGKSVPFLFRDMCATPELASILGPVPVLFTQIVMGTPKALNLRNVAWHGFLLPNEVQPELVSTLFILIASIGELLMELKVEPVTRPQVKDMAMWAAALSELEFTGPVPGQYVVEMLSGSQLVPTGHLLYWRRALDYYKMEKWGWCVLLALPPAEHILRILYCSVNDCPRRILTADASTLYTTLDEILAEQTDEGVPNKVGQFLGEQIMEMMHDLFIHPAGFRIRDRLSHGEVNLEDIPSTVAHFLIVVISSVILKMNQGDSFKVGHRGDFVDKLLLFTDNYKTRFHISSLILGNTKTVITDLYSWEEFPKPNDALDSLNEIDICICKLKSKLLNQLEIGQNGLYFVSKELLFRILSSIHIRTVFRPRIESEILIILKQTIENVGLICENVSQTMHSRYKLFCDRKLRTRGRASYRRMLAFVPVLREVLMCIILIVISQLCSINSVQNLHQEELAKYTKYLRTILQFVENAASNTCENKNRFEEIAQQVTPFCQKMLVAGNPLISGQQELFL